MVSWQLWHGYTKVRALVESSSDSAVKEIEEVAHDVSQSDVAARFDLGAVRQKKDQGQGLWAWRGRRGWGGGGGGATLSCATHDTYQYQAGVVADLGPKKGLVGDGAGQGCHFLCSFPLFVSLVGSLLPIHPPPTTSCARQHAYSLRRMMT